MAFVKACRASCSMRCRAHLEIDHQWHVGQWTPTRQAVWSRESLRTFYLSVHASLTIFVREVGCLVTCGMCSWKSYPALRHGRVVHSAAIWNDIVAALPLWAAMYASHFKRVRTQPTGSLTLIQPLTNACRAAWQLAHHLISSHPTQSLEIKLV